MLQVEDVHLWTAGQPHLYDLKLTLGEDTVDSYFALRTGGRVGITFLLDSGFMWAVVVPTCLLLSRLTPMPIHWLFVCGQGVEGLKAALSLVLLKRVQWVRRLVEPDTKE